MIETVKTCRGHAIRKASEMILLTILLLAGSAGAAETSTFVKDGNAFSSANGSYATTIHCVSGQTCGWISGNETIVGVYYANPDSWGGSLTWTFDLSSINFSKIHSAELIIQWPSYYGKGLHSPVQSGSGSVNVNGNNIANLTTNYTLCGYDYFAHPCDIYSLKYNIPINHLSQSTNIQVSTGSKTAWDIGTVGITIYMDSGNTTSGNITIVDGKIYINGTRFLVKGINYAPWFLGTGPDPYLHHPFPNEFDDVTEKVNKSGRIDVTDYDGDGRIQAWEVIQNDLEIIKLVGANTIRTYAAGEWHDKNLNGVLDRSSIPEIDEIVQGDLPFWVYDRIINFSRHNNMKIILGYWVQEEDFHDESPDPGYQLICDSNDLEVAKDTMGKIIKRYNTSQEIIAWGIGNEVHLDQNHVWFSWGIDINEYLNSLYSYVRSIDPYGRPIMYAKYIGENANFNNLDTEIIAPNAYIFNESELIEKGEFNIPAPQGKAYLLGEFGHDIEDAEGQWDLSKQYAGGIFLEYNDVWWKGSDSLFGIVDANRTKKDNRYSTLYSLFVGIDSTPPAVSYPTASHEIPDDTDYVPLWGETAQLNATVTDDSGVASVTVNLSEIGGSAAQPMTNIGGNIYSTTTNASAGTPPKLYNLTVNATNVFGNSNTSVKIQLRVMMNGDTTGDGKRNIGDALRCANNVSYPGESRYFLSSPYVTDVTGNGLINIGDCLRLANNVSYPGNTDYILK